MSKAFIQMTSGWIPVLVMLLLAAALIAGQASANLPSAKHVSQVSTVAPSVHVVLSRGSQGNQTRKQLHSLQEMIEAFLELPADIELNIEARIGNETSPADSILRGRYQ